MSPDAYQEMAQVQSTHWWFSARREILRGRVAALGLPPSARILEVGSGTGANLDMLAGFGTVTGVEMSEQAIAHASDLPVVRSGRARIVQGRCPEALDSLDGRFDLICLFDVLEHIEADADVLHALSAHLAPGGRIMLTVPAYQWLWSGHDTKLHHFRRYTRSSLERTCEAAGLDVARLSHFNTLLFPLAVAERLACRVSGRESSSGAAPKQAVNAALCSLFSAERHLLGRFNLPFGLSLLALAAPRNA